MIILMSQSMLYVRSCTKLQTVGVLDPTKIGGLIVLLAYSLHACVLQAHVYRIVFKTSGVPSFGQDDAAPKVIEMTSVVYQLLVQRANYGRQHLTSLTYRTLKELNVIVCCARVQGCCLVLITCGYYVFATFCISVITQNATYKKLEERWVFVLLALFFSVVIAIMVVNWLHVFVATASADFSLLMKDGWWKYHVLESKWTLATNLVAPALQLSTLAYDKVCIIRYSTSKHIQC
jgi:hypothetical protein